MPCMILSSDAATRYCHRALPALQKSRLISLRDEAASEAETVSDRAMQMPSHPHLVFCRGSSRGIPR